MAEDGNLTQWTTATTAAVTVLAFVCVCLRIISRLERKQKLWWDDWMIIFSMVPHSYSPLPQSPLLPSNPSHH